MVIGDPIGRADLNRGFRGVAGRATPSIVHQDLDISAERGSRLIMDGGGVFIRRQLSDGNARCFDLGSHLFRSLTVAAMDNHRAALSRQQAGNALTDPATAT